MDNMHSPAFFDEQGLDWLEKTLEQNTNARHTFVFHHVGPRNTLNWWNDSGLSAEQMPDRPHGDEWREKFVAILEEHTITAAFSGHDHSAKCLGDRGGFDMFAVGVRFPMLVEIEGEDVRYSWLMQPASAEPLSAKTIFDKGVLIQVKNWSTMEWRGKIPEPKAIKESLTDNMLDNKKQTDAPQKGKPTFRSRGSLIAIASPVADIPVVVTGTLRHKEGWNGISALMKVVQDDRFDDLAGVHLWIEQKWMGYFPATDNTFPAVTAPRTDSRIIHFKLLIPNPGSTRFDLRGHSLPPILEQPE